MVHYNFSLLLRYPKAEAEEERRRLKAELHQKAESAYNLYPLGKAQIRQGHYRQARQLFRQASEIVDSLHATVPLEHEVPNTTVLSALLKREIQTATQHLRRVVIWLEETIGDKGQGTSSFGTNLQQVLTDYQFSFVDPSLKGFEAYLVGDGEKEDLNALRTQGIQYLIVGHAHAVFSSTSLNNHFYKAQGIVKVFSTQSGEEVLTLSVEGEGYSRDHTKAAFSALGEAGKNVGESLVERLLANGLI
jgi:hypothetical protein